MINYNQPLLIIKIIFFTISHKKIKNHKIIKHKNYEHNN